MASLELAELERRERAMGDALAALREQLSDPDKVAEARRRLAPARTALQHLAKSVNENVRVINSLVPEPEESRAPCRVVPPAAPRRAGRQRESHGNRRGHAMRSSARSGDSGDDPPGSSAPRLTLVRPRAIYTYGVEARERWGLD